MELHEARQEAIDAALQVELDLVNSVNPAKNYPLEKYFKSWYETFKTDISNITLNSYKATHSKLLSYFNDRAIQEITKREYQQFLNKMGQKFTKTTNRKMNGFIRTCIKEEIDEGLINHT